MENLKDKLQTVAGIIPRVYEAGVEEGKVRERSEFWDVFQDFGNRKQYNFAFRGGNFTDKTFYPKYDIIPEGDTTQIFYNFSLGEPFSLTQRLKECGVKLDTSKAEALIGAFSYANKFTEIPTIDLRGLTNRSSDRIGSLFQSCTALVTIEKLIIEEDIKMNGMLFQHDGDLNNIIIEGTIGQNGFDIHWSTKLSRESIESIINALSDTTSGLTVTLSEAACKKAFNVPDDEDIFAGSAMFCDLVLSKSNWTIALI